MSSRWGMVGVFIPVGGSNGHTCQHGYGLCKGANPQRVLTEIIIEIKHLNTGRIAFISFIASNRRYMVFPLRDHFIIKKFKTKE